jgi:hypothetical protein
VVRLGVVAGRKTLGMVVPHGAGVGGADRVEGSAVVGIGRLERTMLSAASSAVAWSRSE